MESVAAFTDAYLPTVSGVSYTLEAWRDEYRSRGGRMQVVCPDASEYRFGEGETPVQSLVFRFYSDFRLGTPKIPEIEADLVHVHTQTVLGLAGLRAARRKGLPVVASYHTPIGEYTDYLSPHPRIASVLRSMSSWWNKAFYNQADIVIAPSQVTKEKLEQEIGIDTEITVIPNGVDTKFFKPVDPADFLSRYDLETGKPLVGYTGRQGHEKNLEQLVRAVKGLDATLVLGGDGPARQKLEKLTRKIDVDCRFLGFLDREELPEFYSAMDVFGMPSPVETQGMVALEAQACGTPVVALDRMALTEAVDDGRTGYLYTCDTSELRQKLEQAIERTDELGNNCLEKREELDVKSSVDRLEKVYKRF